MSGPVSARGKPTRSWAHRHTRLPWLAAAAALLVACAPDAGPTLRRPNGVALTAEGQLLVSDFQNARVARFGADGRFISAHASRGLGEGRIWQAWGLAAQPGGGFVVVDHLLDDVESQTSYLRLAKVFDAQGRQVASFSLTPPDDRGAGWPEGIEPLPGGGWVVGDHERDALLFFDAEGHFQRSLHEIAGGPPLLAPGGPRLRGGRLFVTEYSEHRVRAITLEGAQLLSLGGEGVEPGQLLFPSAVDVAPDGWIAVADLGNYRVQRFEADGSLRDVITPTPASAHQPVQLEDLIVGPSGQLYLCDSKGNRVLVYAEDGTLVRTIDHL